MNGDKLFEAIGSIDEEILERSETPVQPKRRFSFLKAIAACLTLAVTLSFLCVLVKKRISMLPGDQPGVSAGGQRISYEPYYNQAFYQSTMEEDLYYMDFLLTAKELYGFLPNTQEDWMDFTAVYQSIIDRSPAENRLRLSTPTTVKDVNIEVKLGDYPRNYSVSENAVIYRCGKVDYTLWQSDYSGLDMWTVGAYATIHGVPAYFRMDVATEDLEQAKADFEALLLYFSKYPKAGVDFDDMENGSMFLLPRSFRMKFLREEIGGEPAFLPEEDDRVYTRTEIIYEYDADNDYTEITVDCFRGAEQVLQWSILSCPQKWMTLRHATNLPSWDANELTLEAVEKAIDYCDDSVEDAIYFYVDYGDTVICIDAKDIPAQWIYDQLIAARQRQELSKLQAMVAIGQLEGVSLKIYYIDPTILTNAPVSAEKLKTFSNVKTICVDDQALLAHGDSLLKLRVSGFHTPEGEAYENARMCYVFEDAQGNILLQVSFNGPDPDHVYVNSYPAKYDPMYMDIIEPFLTEEFYDTWKYE